MEERGLEHSDVGALCLSTFSVPDSIPESLGESSLRNLGGRDTGVIVRPLWMRWDVAGSSSSPDDVEPELFVCVGGQSRRAKVAARSVALLTF